MKRCGKLFFVGLMVLLLTAVLTLPAFAETENSGGDLLLFDYELTVSDAVDGDLLVFATALEVKGDVHGSIRACTSQMFLDSKVDRNVTVAGLEVMCDEHFEANDVKIAGNQVVFLGSCDTLSVYGETVYIGGTVRGNVYCEAKQVILLEGADISYAEITSSSEPVVAKSVSDTSYSPLENSKFKKIVKFTKAKSAFVSNLISLPFTLLAAVVLALVVSLICKRMSGHALQQFKTHPVLFCLMGIVSVFSIPFLTFFLLILMPAITLSIGVVLLLLYTVLLLLSDAIAAVVLSRVRVMRWNPHLIAAFLAAIIAILSILPYIGFVVRLFCMAVSFGTVLSFLTKRREPIVPMQPEMDFRV